MAVLFCTHDQTTSMKFFQRLFFNDAGRLRSGWRFGIFVGVFVVLGFVLTVGVRVMFALMTYLAPATRLPASFQDLVFRLILLTSSLGAGYICARELEGLPWRSLGLTLHTRWLWDLIVGSAIGVASLALATAIAFAAGGLRFAITSAGIMPIATSLLSSAALFVVAALAEEALCRGYPLQTFVRSKLTLVGVILTSLGFASGHLQNPNAEILAFLNTALAGVCLAVAYLRTRSLWFPLGVHWAWNWALGSLFGLPVSGMSNLVRHPLLADTDLGPTWLTGGAYGIEGGLACTLALIVSTIFIWKTGLVSATEDLKRLTSEENPTTTDHVATENRDSYTVSGS